MAGGGCWLADVGAADIQTLKDAGITVICYFSAGTYESYREDEGSFPKSALGLKSNSEDEWWININDEVRPGAPRTHVRMHSIIHTSSPLADVTAPPQPLHHILLMRGETHTLVMFCSDDDDGGNAK